MLHCMSVTVTAELFRLVLVFSSETHHVGLAEKMEGG